VAALAVVGTLIAKRRMARQRDRELDVVRLTVLTPP
jgi:hypothetical protein